MSHWRKLSATSASADPGIVESTASATSVAGPESTVDECSGGTLDSGDPSVHCALTTPRNYEPGYAYPLIVWFHDRGSDEQELVNVLPHISDRNYAGLSLRGPLPVLDGLPHQRRWSLTDRFVNLLEDEVAISLQQAAEHVNIHWDRVVVAGVGQVLSVALRLLLRRPEWFAGAVCLGGKWTASNRLEAWGQYAQKSLWLGHIQGWSHDSPRAAIRHARLLKTAGFNVTTHRADFEEADPATLGAVVDRWLMQSLCPNSVVM